MAHIKKILCFLGVFVSLLWLAGCRSPEPTSTPTLDLNPYRTEVAATVFAEVTHALGLTPSVTPIPSPTATTPPTSTPTEAPRVSPSAVPSPTATPTSGTPETDTENRAQWVFQSVADDTVFAPGESFTMTWRLKNVGTSKWTPIYLLRFYSGDPFGADKEIPLIGEVLPGGTVDITFQMKAPSKPGNYSSVWVMSDENRSNFKESVYLQIVVAVPATPTPTP